MVRETGHLVGGSAHGAQVITVGVGGGVAIGMTEESRWSKGLDAIDLGLELSSYADFGHWIERFVRPTCEGVCPGELHLEVVHLTVVHLRAVHLRAIHLSESHLRRRRARRSGLAELCHAARGDG